MFSTVVCFALAIYCLYRYLTRNLDYWKKMNIPYDEHPLRNAKDLLLMKSRLQDILADLYNKYPDSPFIGFYRMGTPCLLLTDPDDIELVFVRDSDFFARNDFVIEEDVDPIAARNPFFQVGQKWKRSRRLFMSIFSASKIKHVTPLLVKATEKMVPYIENRKTCEARDLLIRYVADATALSAFCIEGECFEKDDAFYRKLGQQNVEPDVSTGLRIMCLSFWPQLAKLLNIKFITDETLSYFRRTISTALKLRKEHNINNNDFLDTIMELKGDTYTDNDVAAWSFGFFTEPNSSNQGSYVLYALARNPDVQERLRAEIEQVLAQHNGEITYEAIQEMAYLDCVISETLRLYPTFDVLAKRCTGYYEFPWKDNQKEVISVEPGMSILVSISAIHHDERYFENPKEFIPERFSDGNKGKIRKGTYIPFGLGKRTCAGMKFAMILMKISTVAIIKNFEVTVNEKTKEPLELDPKFSLAIPKSRLWLNFTKIN